MKMNTRITMDYDWYHRQLRSSEDTGFEKGRNSALMEVAQKVGIFLKSGDVGILAKEPEFHDPEFTKTMEVLKTLIAANPKHDPTR